MTVKTDKLTYGLGEFIKVSGTVPDIKKIMMPPGGYVVYIDLLDPSAKIINSTKAKPNAIDYTYSASFTITSSQSQQGTYTLQAKFADFASEAKFELKLSASSSLPDLSWSGTRLKFISPDERQTSVTPTAGQLFMVSKEARNNGTIPVYAIAKFQIVDSKGNELFDNWMATTWQPGSTINLAMAVLIQNSGTYKFIATLDPDDEVQEESDSNNISNGIINVADKATTAKISLGKFLPSEAGNTQFEIVVDNKTFSIVIGGDSEGISGIALDKEQKTLSLDNDGTSGSVEVRIPKELLSGNFTVFADDSPISYEKSETGTESKVILNKPEGSFKISIQGTNVIPEFAAPFTIWILAISVTFCYLFFRINKRRNAGIVE